MAGNSCIYTPEVNGQASKLYLDLSKRILDRPLTNLIYAAYLQTGIAAWMDSNGMTARDNLGQHTAEDVMKAFDVTTMQHEAIRDRSTIARNIGAVDANGNFIDYDDASVALGIATRTNANSKGVIAYVTQHGDKFNINVVPRDSRTQLRAAQERAKQETWDVLKQAFNTIGIDLDHSNLDVSLANANKSAEFASWIKVMHAKTVPFRLLSLQDIQGLFTINQNSSQVQRLITMFGTLDQAAQAAYYAYRTRGSVTPAQMALIDATIDNSMNFDGLDVGALMAEVDRVNQTMVNSTESAIDTTLRDLNRKFRINVEEHNRINEEIHSLSDAADEAITTIKRQYEQLKAQFGEFDAVTKNARRILYHLQREIDSKRYYAGILGFMGEANSQVTQISNALRTPSTQPTQWGQMKEMSTNIMKFKSLYDGYYHILRALTDINGLIVDEIISDTDKQTIADTAKQLVEVMNQDRELIKGKDGLGQSLMTDLSIAVLGDRLADGVSTAYFVAHSQMDSTFQDRYLYSVGRMSNPLINAMGSIIQDTRHNYNEKVQDYSIRVRRAHHKLRQAGFTDTRFMYDENGMIISDIDWEAYKTAYGRARNAARRNGTKGLALEEYMTDWVEQNTEDRIVDPTNNNRTERVPNSHYRKAFPALAQAQLDYYHEMMQIKAELGSLLPSYAQKQFVPPQIRRSFVDAVIDAVKGRNGNVFKALVKALVTKIQNIYTIREDDTDYAQSGIINGEEYLMTSGNLDNTPFRQIPIFYINKIKDTDEVIRDFSGAMQHFLQSALHFEAMNNVRDVLEFMGNYIVDKHAASTKNGVRQAEVVSVGTTTIIKELYNNAKNSNTSAIIDGVLDYHLFGVKMKNTSPWVKALKSLLMYNSIRSLTVNVKGAISNYVVGLIQMIIEAGGREYYGFKDLAWAWTRVLGDNTPGFGAGTRIVDYVMNTVNSESVLLAQKFDPLNEASAEQGRKRYYGPLRTLLSPDLTFIGYGAGEHMIHFINMYAVLHNRKVHLNGKEVSLYDIFSVGNKADGNSELLWDHNATYTDEEGNEVPVDEAYFIKVKEDIKRVNQTTHGSMNEMDKGLIHQYIAGRFVMNLRQWMIEHFSRRFRTEHRDANIKKQVEGYYITLWRFLTGIADNRLHMEHQIALHWKTMNKHQRANVRRAASEFAVLVSLIALQFGLGAPEDHKKEWWYRMLIYQVKRCIVDVNGSTPWGLPMEFTTLINSPISATNTVNALFYPFTGVSDVFETIQRGKHKGENKYWRNIQKYWFPFTKQIEQYMDFGEDESMFKVYDRQNLQ